ncbi:MAG: hypothetical protein PVJ09_04205 [Candidatus Woesebacteria bacterium]
MSYPLFSISFILHFLLFILALFFSLYLPGSFFINSLFSKSKVPQLKKYSALLKLVSSLVLGLVLWTAQGVFFGYLRLRNLSYLYIIFFFLAFLWQKKPSLSKIFVAAKAIGKNFKSINPVVLIFLTIGSFLQLLVISGSGFLSEQGIKFYFDNAAEPIMHLAYIQALIRNFPAIEPGLATVPLLNYHYWSDFFMAELARVWQLPVIHLYFHFLPPLLAILSSFLIYLIVKAWRGTDLVAFLALFFFFFGADAAYTIYFLLHRQLSFHVAGIDNGMEQFFNSPHVFAKLIFLASLLVLFFWQKLSSKQRSLDKKWGLLYLTLAAPLVGFKVYYGIFSAIALSVLVAVRVLKAIYKKDWRNWRSIFLQEKFSLFLLFLFALISATIYFPTNSSAGGLFFIPLEWPKLLLAPHNLDFNDWFLRQQVYHAAGNIRNLLILDFLAILIALISIHGTRLIGFLPTKKLAKILGFEYLLYLLIPSIIFTIAGFFTLQQSGAFNVFNFFIVSLIVFSFFAAFRLADFLKSKNFFLKILAVLIIILTVPKSTHALYLAATELNDAEAQILVSKVELEAFIKLRSLLPATAVVQSHPKNSLDQDTPYLSFFLNRQSYSAGFNLLENLGKANLERKTNLEKMFLTEDATSLASEMRQRGIDYLYLQKKPAQKLNFDLAKSDNIFKVLYEDELVLVVGLAEQ